jgi:hypothetical protein
MRQSAPESRQIVETVEKFTKRGYLAWQSNITGLVVNGNWQSIVRVK